jgi:hypothetical protein
MRVTIRGFCHTYIGSVYYQYYLADYNEQGQCGTATEPQILYTGHLQYKPWKRPKPSLFTNTFSKSMYHGCLVLKVKIRARKGV